MNTNFDWEKIYQISKTLYPNVHVKRTLDGIRIEQKVKGYYRDSFFVEIDLIGKVVRFDRKANKKDLIKLDKIFNGYEVALTIINK